MNNPFNAGRSQMPNINSLYQSFMKNPTQALMQSGFKIPENMTKSPQSIIQHLLNSGQISQAQLNNAQQAMSRVQQMIKR